MEPLPLVEDPSSKRRSIAPKRSGVSVSDWIERAFVETRTAFRNILRNRRRTGLAVAAAAFGVSALIVAGGFIEWMQWAMREGTIETRLGHIQVVRKDFFHAGLADPFRYLIPDTGATVEALRSIPHVKTIAPRLSFSGLASHGDLTLSFVGEGVDPSEEAHFQSGVVMRAGSPLDAEDSRSAIVGQGLAESLRVRLGDRIVLLAATRSGGMNGVELVVRGIFSTVSKAYDDAALRVPLKTAQDLLRISGVHRLVLLLDQTERTDETLARVRPNVEMAGMEAVPWYDLADFYRKSSTLLSRQFLVMRIIVAAVVAMTILNTMIMNVLERISEIGTLMALGARRSNVLVRFLIEGLAIGVVGGILGVAIGLLAAYVLSTTGIPMPPPPGMSGGYTARVLVSPGLVLDAALLVAALAAVAGLYPAWKASRLEIVDALRHGR